MKNLIAQLRSMLEDIYKAPAKYVSARNLEKHHIRQAGKHAEDLRNQLKLHQASLRKASALRAAGKTKKASEYENDADERGDWIDSAQDYTHGHRALAKYYRKNRKKLGVLSSAPSHRDETALKKHLDREQAKHFDRQRKISVMLQRQNDRLRLLHRDNTISPEEMNRRTRDIRRRFNILHIKGHRTNWLLYHHYPQVSIARLSDKT